jgi:hypothetical protein|tara:strand:- start:244 stop:444 length:201 start_codon:yes stop_codon:yes gene_type:complete
MAKPMKADLEIKEFLKAINEFRTASRKKTGLIQFHPAAPLRSGTYAGHLFGLLTIEAVINRVLSKL